MEQHAGDENRRDYKKRSAREAAYHAIDSERDHQQAKYPGNKPIESHAGMLARYAKKLEEATLDRASTETLTALMRKIAAIAVRAMEEHGAPLRAPVQDK